MGNWGRDMEREMRKTVESNTMAKMHTEEHGGGKMGQIPREQDHWRKSHPPDKQIKKKQRKVVLSKGNTHRARETNS